MIITDNSKVNINLLKENVEHKETILFLGKENNALKAQLAHLDDVEGLARIIYNLDNSTQFDDGDVYGNNATIRNLYEKQAQAIINYIKRE